VLVEVHKSDDNLNIAVAGSLKSLDISTDHARFYFNSLYCENLPGKADRLHL
jgi:hypothetical protein